MSWGKERRSRLYSTVFSEPGTTQSIRFPSAHLSDPAHRKNPSGPLLPLTSPAGSGKKNLTRSRYLAEREKQRILRARVGENPPFAGFF